MASFKSVLSTIGKDVKAVFNWLGSSNGQAAVADGEAVLEAVYPPAAGLIALANVGLTEIIKIEALAAGAGSQDGTGAQKLTAVTTAVTPEVLTYAQQHGLPAPTAAMIQNAVNGLVAFANALEGKA